MTFTAPLAGTYSFEGTIPSQAMNNINTDIPKALDKTGDNATNSGGITGRVDILSTGQLKVLSGGALRLDAGSAMSISGSASIASTGSVFCNSGSIVEFGGGSTLTIDSGATFQLSAGASANCFTTVEFKSGSKL